MRSDSAVLKRALRAMTDMPEVPDTSSWVHSAAMVALNDAGFRVVHEFPIEGDGFAGRIDIVAFDDATGDAVAIEIDARKPRKGSLRKLRAFDGWRVCVSRGVMPAKADGIDGVCFVRVRQASEAQIAAKRGVKMAAGAIKARNT